jgi:hypothetical protein
MVSVFVVGSSLVLIEKEKENRITRSSRLGFSASCTTAVSLHHPIYQPISREYQEAVLLTLVYRAETQKIS